MDKLTAQAPSIWILIFLGILSFAVGYIVFRNILNKIRGKIEQNVPSTTLHEGDILVDKEFGGKWVKIKIVAIGANGKNCLYQFITVKGKPATSRDVHDLGIRTILTYYTKVDKDVQ